MKECRLENSPIVYYVSGSEHAEWALFLHAAFVDHRMFRTQLAYFAGRYNVLTLDIVGHGKSTDLRRGDGVDKMSLWIREILRREGIEQVHLVGVSLGAVLAQDFANKYPSSVRSLACFGGYDINNFDPSLQKENGAAQLRMMLRAVFSVRRFAEANKSISAHTAQAQEEFYQMNLAFPKKSFMVLSSLNSLINVGHAVPRPYPLLIGCGEYDIPSELDAVRQWQQTEPDCRAAIFEGAGHCVNMDTPQQFNETLLTFWSDVKEADV